MQLDHVVHVLTEGSIVGEAMRRSVRLLLSVVSVSCLLLTYDFKQVFLYSFTYSNIY